MAEAKRSRSAARPDLILAWFGATCVLIATSAAIGNFRYDFTLFYSFALFWSLIPSAVEVCFTSKLGEDARWIRVSVWAAVSASALIIAYLDPELAVFGARPRLFDGMLKIGFGLAASSTAWVHFRTDVFGSDGRRDRPWRCGRLPAAVAASVLLTAGYFYAIFRRDEWILTPGISELVFVSLSGILLSLISASIFAAVEGPWPMPALSCWCISIVFLIAACVFLKTSGGWIIRWEFAAILMAIYFSNSVAGAFAVGSHGTHATHRP